MVVRSSEAHGADIYVKGAPECMKEICHPDSCRCFRGPSLLPCVILLISSPQFPWIMTSSLASTLIEAFG